MKIKYLILFSLLFASVFLNAQQNDSTICQLLGSGYWSANYDLATLETGDTLILKRGKTMVDLTFKKNGTLSYKRFVWSFAGEPIRTGKVKGIWHTKNESSSLLILDFSTATMELRLISYQDNYITFTVQKKVNKTID